ncbi:MAG: glycosyltransferase [Cyanobium sp. ELA507]
MLSLSMLARNEAGQIEAALASVADFVDEMVVLDTGSTDDTVAIAERCGAVVHSIAWPGDFAPARNRALELVRGDWVLVLDADERLRPEARQPLLELMQQPDLLLVTLLRQELGAAQSPYSSVSRLFRRHGAIRWSRPYHAMVDDSVMALLAAEPHWRLAQCPEPALLHTGYRPELLADGSKARRLRQAMEADLREHPGDPYASAKLGALLVEEGERAAGIALLEQGLAQCPAGADPERFELLLHLAIAHGAGSPDLAIPLYRQALALPLDPRLTLAARLNLAGLLLEAGATGQSTGQASEQAREQASEEAALLCREATTAAPAIALAWSQLGLVERRRGAIGAAINAYRRALSLDPDHTPTHQNLAVALLLGGDIPGCRAAFRQTIRLLEEQGRPEEARALARQAATMVRLDD